MSEWWTGQKRATRWASVQRHAELCLVLLVVKRRVVQQVALLQQLMLVLLL